MKIFIILAGICLLSGSLFAQHTIPAQDTANIFTNTNSFTLGVDLGPVTFSNLPTVTGNTRVIMCSDCTQADPCAAGGTGALAKRINGAWSCAGGGNGGGGGGGGGTITGSASLGSLPKMVTNTTTLGTSLFTDDGTVGAYGGSGAFTANGGLTTSATVSANQYTGTGTGGLNIGCNQSSLPATPGASKDGIFCGTDGIYFSFNNDAWKKVLRTGGVDAGDVTSGQLDKTQINTSSSGNGLGTALVSQSDVANCTGFLDYSSGTWTCEGLIQRTITTNDTVASGDIQNVVFGQIAADSTLTIPAPTGAFSPPSFFFVKNSSTSTGRLTLSNNTGITINGGSSTSLNSDAWAIVYAPDASHWNAFISSASGVVVVQ